MGRVEYAVISLRDDTYLEDIQETLGAFFDIGVNQWGVGGEALAEAFVASGIAREFERRNPVFVAGKSALDLLRMIAPFVEAADEPPHEARVSPSEEYWLGWILGFYQVRTGRPYRQVLDVVPFDELLGMYYPLHEAPEAKFVEVLDARVAAALLPTRLKRQRELCGMTQEELAGRSGVSLRSIQMYEQRQKNINHASAESVYRLACALHCSMEGLLQF